MAAYYNEINPFAAQWLRNLIGAGHIAPGEVDERSIVDVVPDDLRGFSQCHFFAGIGGWSYALRLAGWPDGKLVWTGSCPCQPFSSSARGRVTRRDDERHLWPTLRGLIAARSPSVVFGEQVSNAGDWFDEVCDDLEGLGYTVGAGVLPACSVGLDHARPRIFFVGHSYGHRKPGMPIDAEVARLPGTRGKRRGVEGSHGVPGRLGALRAYGNAIVPAVAAEFIAAYMECEP